MNKILVTGGAGYCGSLLIPQLLSAGYQTTVYDILYFGSDFLPLTNPNLRLVEGDVRDISSFKSAVAGNDIVLHLACISNDASFILDEKLSTSINMDAFEPLVMASKEAGVKRFVYASSSSVYGVSEASDVTEDHPLVPLTLYNKYKGLCEPLLFKHTDDTFVGVIFRPATVCGRAPRQRLDLSVNILTNHAVNKGIITVFGGDQLRPNLHVQDYVDLCFLLISAEDKKVAEWMKKYRNHGMIDRDHIEFWGVNMRLQPLQAIVAMSRMKDLEDTIKIRNHNAMIYDNAFYELRNDVTLPQRYEGHTETFALYMGLFRQRDQLAAYLNKNGIETKIHYPVPLHQQKAAEQKCRISGDMTNADYQAQHLLTLPVHQYLREEQLSYTVDCISNFYRNA